MTDALYRKYLNVQLFVEKYRKFKINEPFLSQKEFKKKVQIEQYINIKGTDPKTGRTIYIYLMKVESKFVKATPNFKKLMESLGTNPADVYIITKNPLSIYINKVLYKYSNLKIQNFLHKHFSIEITKGPHCSKHTILSDEEVIKTCNQELMIHPLAIPPIYITDPICIWIGAEIGQVLKIEANSENSGKVVRYRIVSPKIGRLSMDNTIKKLNKKVSDSEKEEISDDSDSEKEEISDDSDSEKEEISDDSDSEKEEIKSDEDYESDEDKNKQSK